MSRRSNSHSHAAHGGSSRHAATVVQNSAELARRNRRAGMLGFLVAVVGYLLLSIQQPVGWGEGLWAALAFLLVPALGGLVVNLAQERNRASGKAFFAARKSVGWAMFLYAGITLIVLAIRVGSPDGGMFLAGLVATVVYTILAGVVAGLVNLALTRVRANTNRTDETADHSADRREDSHGAAS